MLYCHVPCIAHSLPQVLYVKIFIYLVFHVYAYLQVVWANTRRVGCGMADCPGGVSYNGRLYHRSVFTCSYDPPGAHTQSCSNAPPRRMYAGFRLYLPGVAGHLAALLHHTFSHRSTTHLLVCVCVCVHRCHQRASWLMQNVSHGSSPCM
jgi:hypothetical protein